MTHTHHRATRATGLRSSMTCAALLLVVLSLSSTLASPLGDESPVPSRQRQSRPSELRLTHPSIIREMAVGPDDKDEVEAYRYSYAAVRDADEAAARASQSADGSALNGTAQSALAFGHFATEFDGMRTAMLDSAWMSNTDASSASAMHFLRSFPRRKSSGGYGPHQLQQWDGSWGDDALQDYIGGMFFMWGVPVFFAFLAIACWLGFCIARCWCNVCGRQATRLYTKKQVYINYAAGSVLITVMGVMCAFGWTGNVEVSQGIDQGFSAATVIANYGYEFMGVFSTAYSIAYDAVQLGEDFNTTLALLPYDSTLVAYQDCTDTSYDELVEQQQLVSTLGTIMPYFTGNADYTLAQSQAAAGVGAVASAKASLATAEATTPAGGVDGQTMLENLQTQLAAVNASFATLPSSADLETLITNLATLQADSVSGGTASTMAELSADFSTLYDATVAIVPTLLTTVYDGFGDILTAYTFYSCVSSCSVLSTAISQANALTNTTSSLDAFNTTLTKVLAGLAALPSDFATLETNMATLETNLATMRTVIANVSSLIDSYTDSLSGWPASGATIYTDVDSGILPISQFQESYGDVMQLVLATELPTLILAIAAMQTGIPTAIAAFSTNQDQVSDVNSNVDTTPIIAALVEFNSTVGSLSCFPAVLDLVAVLNDNFFVLPTAVTTAQSTLDPLVTAQVAALSNIYTYINGSISEMAVINATVSSQADYSTLKTQLTTLLGVVNDLHTNFTILFEELLALDNSLYALTGTGGVVVVRSSTDALWGDVASVTARDNTDTYSAIEPFTDTYANLQITDALDSLSDALTHTSTGLQALLIKGGLSATSISGYTSTVENIDTYSADLASIIAGVMPITTTLSNDTTTSLVSSLTSLQYELVYSGVKTFRTKLENMNTTVTTSSVSFPDMKTAILGADASLQALAGIGPLLRYFHDNATASALPQLQVMLTAPTELNTLNDAFGDVTELDAANALIQAEAAAYLLPNTLALLTAINVTDIFMSSTSRDLITAVLGRFVGFHDKLPDFNTKINDGLSAIDSLSDALSWMSEKKQSYIKTSAEWEDTIDNYDGVRLLLFNMGVLLPFFLSLWLIVSAMLHFPCPAMLAGIIFFPSFVLFMGMSALQMIPSVFIADICHDATGEIEIQTAGRFYAADKLAFFNLTEDINFSAVARYFTECVGDTPEFVDKMTTPLTMLQQNGLDFNTVQAAALAAVGGDLEFAETLQDEFTSFSSIQNRTTSVFALAVTKLNCTRSSAIYDQAYTVVCDSFGPPFALTTCIFLLTAVFMVPGIFIAITSYKRFNALNLDTAYTQAPNEDPDNIQGLAPIDMPMQEALAPEVQEGWN